MRPADRGARRPHFDRYQRPRYGRAAITSAADDIEGFRIDLPIHIRLLEANGLAGQLGGSFESTESRREGLSYLLGDDAGPLGRIAEIQERLRVFDGSDNDPRIGAWTREIRDLVEGTGVDQAGAVALTRSRRTSGCAIR